ncbi:unnamed protein product [Clonostachys rosea f. rosea IK726]|uniref:Uncharacterized protein n=4 Tax=Clonostachys rosea f. rosea IK726 TaxID=1349383 RepID=A0ACA9UQI3_BIOOC|nr:unnamed protein product [Clonostachys rosea f. rosea IK726]CAG9955476.1 unnamed protein product [Clonostachys rosea f. rosea IK726]CAG9955479.1 unnamed protein product [Clonostachys rosea f. rosea IK726]CAG9955482.1 unnamed protein product [Clonostachys rosea f. rosea IK726]
MRDKTNTHINVQSDLISRCDDPSGSHHKAAWTLVGNAKFPSSLLVCNPLLRVVRCSSPKSYIVHALGPVHQATMCGRKYMNNTFHAMQGGACFRGQGAGASHITGPHNRSWA